MKNNGSFLSEDYTKKIKKMYKYAVKAHELYGDIPVHIRISGTDASEESLGYYLSNGVVAIRDLANKFNIELDKED